MAAEEDYFGSDDDFNLDQLQEIENAALLASLTQKQQKAEQLQPQSQPPPPIQQQQRQQQQQQQQQPPKNPYQISSKAASYNSNRQNATQSHHPGPNRPYANLAFQPPRPAPPPAPKNLSAEEQEVRAAYLARNQERQRLRQQQQDTYLAQQRQAEQQPNPTQQQQQQHATQTIAQQQAYINEQRQTQLSQTYTHRQRQLQPRSSYRQPTPSYITQPTLPSTPGDRSRFQNSTKRPLAGVDRATNGTAKPAVPTNIARPEEYANYDQAKELWDTGAATEVVVQEAARGTAALEASALGTSAFGTSAWISSNEPTLGKTATLPRVTNHDMVDYDAVAEAGVARAGESAAMDVDGGKGPTAHDIEELEALRKATQQLLLEKDELQKKLKQATVEVQTKTGENMLLRKKIEKAETEHRSEVDAIRSYAQQKSDKADEEMAKLRADVVKMQADLEFDRNDQQAMHRELKQYQEKDKQLPKSVKDTMGLQTPRKNRITELCDGFDADEAGMVRSSPPVGMPGSRGRRTPSKSAKRKRKPNESPMKHSQTLMLPILQSGGNLQRSMMMESGPEPEEEDFDAMIDKMTLEELGLGNDDRQQFLENILSFKPNEGQLTILEILENYHFPSEAGTSLAALFMENVPQADVDSQYGEFPAKICSILIALWDRCYTEKFFEPLSLLLGFLHHVIDCDFGGQLFPIILEPFVEVLQKTVMLNSLERFKGRYDRINPLVDVEQCLRIFETVALGVLIDDDLNRHFWALIQPDFIAPFMTYNQPMSHIRLILNTLPSSVSSTSYGPISPDPLQQKDYERVTLIHASFLLTTEPKVDPTVHPGHRRAEILSIRSAILTFYSCIASTTHGITSLVTNSNWQALSRIIVRLHHELEEVYEDRYGIENSVKFINNGVSFIHRVLKLQTSNDDIERMLGSTAHNGNGYKHLVLFARVAFVKEGDYLSRAGVLPETVEMAMEVLEGSVTMEQGDEIWGLFKGREDVSVGGDSMTESMLEGDRVLREEEMKR
ncbi:hypothetical protein TWF569_003405 [Orbilia oligospora]|nr:hypothetical protein TWF569_003405 [Orbilia oligospora]